MVQVRDNGKVCRLAVPTGVFALHNRGVGKSHQSSNGVQTSLGAARCAATLPVIAAHRPSKHSPVLTMDHGQSRQITVNDASLSRIAHQRFAGAGKVHQGKSRLIPVNPASQFFPPARSLFAHALGNERCGATSAAVDSKGSRSGGKQPALRMAGVPEGPERIPQSQWVTPGNSESHPQFFPRDGFPEPSKRPSWQIALNRGKSFFRP